MGIQLLLCLLALAIHREIQVQACNEEYTSPNGTVSSPSYPREYPNNQDCIYIINATAGHRITLEFSTFELQAGISGCNDFLQVRDENSENSPSLGIFCNQSVPERLRSTANTMWIRFHSDSSQPGAGFEATYTTAIIPQKFLLVTRSGPGAIFRIDIDTGSNFSIPIAGLQYPSGVDYDAIDGRIYWADILEKTIRSAKLDGSDVQLVRNLSEGALPLAVSVDSLSRLIFYTEAKNNFICMISIYSKQHRIVLALSPDNPRDIELDKHRGVMYYSVWGDTPRIQQANYDGSGRETLVSGTEYVYRPTGLTLDRSSERLYWADTWTDKIGWTDLNSKTTEVIFKDSTRDHDYIGIAIYQSQLFIADWGPDSIRATRSYIHRMSTDGRNWTNITTEGRMQEICVYVEETEDKGPNGCGSNNGGCSYICIPLHENRSKCLSLITMFIQHLLWLLIPLVHRQVQACGSVYNSPNGSISSPLYGNYSPTNEDCIYIINSTMGSRITLRFRTFHLHPGTCGCNYDFLKIRDGSSEDSPSLGEFCGKTVPDTVRSSANTMWIRFRSNSSETETGFEANYTTEIIPEKFLLVTVYEPSIIYRIDIDTGSQFIISVDGLQYPAGVDYDSSENRMYVAQMWDEAIVSANLDGSDVQLISNLSTRAALQALSVDSLSRLIFYTDTVNCVIGMITMYSKVHRTVIVFSLEAPMDLELDKHRGVMYYTVWGSTNKIERASYDGTSRKTLKSGVTFMPTGLALDTRSERLYWADSFTQDIGWMDLEGKSTSVIFNDREQDNDYIGMDIYLNELFVVDWGPKKMQTTTSYIHRINTDGRNITTILMKGRMQDIRVYAEETEDKEPNGCGGNNGGCSYICIPTAGNGSKCISQGKNLVCAFMSMLGISALAMAVGTENLPESGDDRDFSVSFEMKKYQHALYFFQETQTQNY